MKKNKTIEMKIYELLGIKVFRKMAFRLRDTLNFPLTIKMSKEEKKAFLYKTSSNYNMGRIKNLEDVKKFKKYLYLNTGVHIFGIFICLPTFLKVVDGTASLFSTIINLTCIGINIYCVMLQRYNCIRINQLIKKMTARYEKQKEAIKEELRKDDLLLMDHTYKIVDKEKRETSITLEDLIANANIEELKQYRLYLVYFKQANQNIQKYGFNYDEKEMDISLPIEKDKFLKLEIKKN